MAETYGLTSNQSTHFFLETNGIIPRAANDRVSELMVAPEKKEEFIKEAEAIINFILELIV